MKKLKALVPKKKGIDCANCQREISGLHNKVNLAGKNTVVEIINRQRSETGKPLIATSDCICRSCLDSACVEACKSVPAVVKLKKADDEPVYQNVNELLPEENTGDELCARCNETFNNNGGRVFLQENSVVLVEINRQRQESEEMKPPLDPACFICYKCFNYCTKYADASLQRHGDKENRERALNSTPSTTTLKTHPVCSQCGNRLSRTVGRPRTLEANSNVLKGLNALRAEMNKPAIIASCKVCFSCYKSALPKSAEMEKPEENTDDDNAMEDEDQEIAELSQNFTESVTVSQSTNSWSANSQSVTDSEQLDDIQEDYPNISLDINSLPICETWCCVCQKLSRRVNVPTEARVKLWLESGVFMPYENRICKEHIDQDTKCLKGAAVQSLQNINFLTPTTFNTKSLTRWITELSSKCESIPNRGRLSFRCLDYFALDDFDCFFGINRVAFLEMHKICEPYLRNTKARSTFDAVAMFLIKLRQNPSLRTIACMFGVSRQAVGQCIIKVRQILFKNFVNKHLGYHHVSRETYIKEWHTHMATKLSGAKEGQAIVIIDGTYLKIQKSSNYKVQRKTWSLHKYANLVKPMMIVAPNGKILAVEGPYLANAANSDANIFKSMLKDKEGFRSFFRLVYMAKKMF